MCACPSCGAVAVVYLCADGVMAAVSARVIPIDVERFDAMGEGS